MKNKQIADHNRASILLIVLLTVTLNLAQTQSSDEKGKPEVKISRQTLPDQWNGICKGMTVSITADGKRQEIAMERHVLPLENGSAKIWKILYGKDSDQTARPYEIMPVPNELNRFVVDEKNGLFLDNQLVGNVLYSQFMVTTNLVTTRSEIKDDEIKVEMIMFDLRSPRQSKLNGGNIEVASYSFRSA
jgi:hypothetical protein